MSSSASSASQRSSSNSATGATCWKPALATIVSSPPNASTRRLDRRAVAVARGEVGGERLARAVRVGLEVDGEHLRAVVDERLRRRRGRSRSPRPSRSPACSRDRTLPVVSVRRRERDARPDPQLGVPPDRRGRPRAPRAQALRAARPRRRRGPRPHARRRPRAATRRHEERHGVIVHRVREPDFPRDDVDAFIAWVDHMNARHARRRASSWAAASTSSTRTTGSSPRRRAGSRARWKVPWLVTVHATEYGRHQGWVDKHPQSHIHGVERRMVRGADRVITCSAYMREHVADAFGHRRPPRHGDPERDRPDRPAARRRPAAAARAVRRAGREARAARRAARLREGLPPRARGDAAADRAARRRPLPRRRHRHRGGRAEGAGRASSG